MDLIQRVTLGRMKKNELSDFHPGDTVAVHVKIKEGEKERIQLFKGVVLKIQGHGAGRNFTVRKMSSGIGVERTFPYSSPAVEKVEVFSKGKVRRAKLFYLRALRGRAARIESELVTTAKKSK